MKSRRFFVYLAAALATILSLTNAQPARAVLPRGEDLAASSPPPLLNIKAIDLGFHHTCALTIDGGVKCWGDNTYGQLGDGTTTDRITPTDVMGLNTDVIAISTGKVHTCALISGGGVKCWGDNNYGALGDGTTTQRFTPTDVIGLTDDVTAISVGDGHTCALNSNGGVECWGKNWRGQLGDGTTTERHTPVEVIGLTNGVIAISAGYSHTCALISGGAVKCWGDNTYGQLGDGTRTQQLTPIDVFGLTNGISSVSSGEKHTCAVNSSGGAMCWGNNTQGALGDGTTTSRLTPTAVNGLATGVDSVSTGISYTCAVTVSGGAKCWGYNWQGQLGDGTTIRRLTPTDVSGLSNGVGAVSADNFHTCAMTSGGGVKCWGANGSGQLGDGTVTNRLTPVDVIVVDKIIFRSVGAQDGYIWESTETSLGGLLANSADTTFRVGDDNLDRQYRAILSFNTSPLSDTAVVISAQIQLRYAGHVGITVDFGRIFGDIRKPYFGSSVWLLPNDFQSAPSMAVAINSWTWVEAWWVKNEALPYINLTGPTQFRIRFQKDDDDDMNADYLKYYSGNAPYAYRPQLIIYYYVP